MLNDFYDNSYAPKAQKFCAKAIKLSHLPIQIFPPSAKLYSLCALQFVCMCVLLAFFALFLLKQSNLQVRVIDRIESMRINLLKLYCFYTNVCKCFYLYFYFFVLWNKNLRFTKSKRSKNYC